MSQTRHRVVFLYSELAGYFLACAKELGQHPKVESVDIVHWPLNPEAPFQFSSTPQYTLHPKKNFNRGELKQFLAQINPTAIVCSGWMDADYNAMAKAYCKLIPVVLTLDNWWTGSLKQWLAVLSSPFFIRRHFNRAWVPGAPQKPFAERLGFRRNHLATGFYCADPRPFEKIHEARQKYEPSKKLLYVGRYLDIKGVRELWHAFAKLSPAFPDWELHCIGTGDLWDERMQHPKIVHHGFKQPHELAPFLEDAACFVMPSKKEPWGVVVHEMAIAGIPLLVSDQVGACSLFLQNELNGSTIHHSQLESILINFMKLPISKTRSMSQHSHRLGLSLTPTKWAESCLQLIHS
jgi:glycosyltransferase involved in cell wall biosynthesis